MNYQEIQDKIENTKISWNCHLSRNEHEVGCPHRKWSVEELQDALIRKKKFEQSRLAGTILTE